MLVMGPPPTLAGKRPRRAVAEALQFAPGSPWNRSLAVVTCQAGQTLLALGCLAPIVMLSTDITGIVQCPPHTV
jgi:hypothetical protein